MAKGLTETNSLNLPYLLAHDLGTTGNKATLFRSDGTSVASTFAAYTSSYPQPGWAEQDPADWRQAIFASTRHLLAKSSVRADQIAAVSFSGHMNGALLVDSAGQPLRPHILWADQRATEQAALIRECCGEDEIYRLTGIQVSPAWTAAKLLWIKQRQPDIYRQARKVLQAKDYAAFLLSGVLATDYSDASLTQLLDLEQRCWSETLLERLELDRSLLPDLHASATVIGQVTREAAEASGLQAGTPVVIGAGDGACATVGAGAVREGDIYNYLGSSSWVAVCAEGPLLDAQQRTFNLAHADPDLVIAIGAMQTAGGAFDWLERLLRAHGIAEPEYEALNVAASQARPGGNGLLFLPYLLGERSPHWNPLARGAFVGLTMPTDRGELARAVLEGVAFNLRHILDVLRSQGAQVDAALAPEGPLILGSSGSKDSAGVRLIGGGGKSPLWRQILADIYGLPVQQIDLPAQATALGAAIIGGVGVGIFPNYDMARDLAPVQAVSLPDPARRTRYEALYSIFKDSYIALESIFQRLATLPD